MEQQLSEKLTELGKKITTDSNFSNIYKFFFDHLAENDDFLNVGKRKKNPILKKIIQSAGEQILLEKATVTKLVLIHVKSHDFYHGACVLNGHPSSLIYFNNTKTGIVCISLPNGRIMYSRFSSTVIDGEQAIVVDGDPNTTH